jgi:hypothetical protein
MTTSITWPSGKRFAFTIVDDTDGATVDNVRPIYELFEDLGLRTTKTVWPLRPIQHAPLGGQTLEDDDYRRWILDLHGRGFEIGFHGVTDHPSTRQRTEEALNLWHRTLGNEPRLYASHSGQREAMYWGPERLSGIPRQLFRRANELLDRDVQFFGEIERSPYFWGDLCQQHIEYTRNFTFKDINTLARDRAMPWHDPRKPFVRYWFSSSDGATAKTFCELIRDENQDRLADEGGACIVYTHLAYGFTERGRVDATVARLLTRLAERDGWFVPCSVLLDHLRSQPGWRPRVGPMYLEQLQWRWILDNVRTARGAKYARRVMRKLGLRV